MGERKSDSNCNSFFFQGLDILLRAWPPMCKPNFPNTILRGHHCCILSWALPKTIVIGLKTSNKQELFLPSYTKRELVQPDLSPLWHSAVEAGLAVQDQCKLWGIPGQWEQVAHWHHLILCSGLSKLSLHLAPTGGSRRVLYRESLHITLIKTSLQQQPKSFPQVLPAHYMSKTLELQEPSSIPEGGEHSTAIWVK